ncbi:hypothetical protein VP01_984g4 [Puccinia sorghi]|uniref:Uncharacterized protein n=1 Tax=Puccinia sorghi TaxID=27349 RepID=A0A0L6U7M4_9BASI|nr:hypothetical protein VP01_984g4 [Puccinia sorghi]
MVRRSHPTVDCETRTKAFEVVVFFFNARLLLVGPIPIKILGGRPSSRGAHDFLRLRKSMVLYNPEVEPSQDYEFTHTHARCREAEVLKIWHAVNTDMGYNAQDESELPQRTEQQFSLTQRRSRSCGTIAPLVSDHKKDGQYDQYILRGLLSLHHTKGLILYHLGLHYTGAPFCRGESPHTSRVFICIIVSWETGGFELDDSLTVVLYWKRWMMACSAEHSVLLRLSEVVQVLEGKPLFSLAMDCSAVFSSACETHTSRKKKEKKKTNNLNSFFFFLDPIEKRKLCHLPMLKVSHRLLSQNPTPFICNPSLLSRNGQSIKSTTPCVVPKPCENLLPLPSSRSLARPDVSTTQRKKKKERLKFKSSFLLLRKGEKYKKKRQVAFIIRRQILCKLDLIPILVAPHYHHIPFSPSINNPSKTSTELLKALVVSCLS